MNINYELYRIFYVVAKAGNITKAANELMISQPAISKSIKNLEEQLGGNLFTRTQKGVALTKEGKEFYNYIEKAILYIDNAENKFTSLINLETGKINVGVSSTKLVSVFLMESLSSFHKLYPKIKIELMIGETHELINQLRNGFLDTLIVLSPIEENNDLNVYKCKEVDVCFVSNYDNQELINKEISLKDLSNYPLILPVREFNDRDIIEEYSSSNGIILSPSLELSSYGLIRDFSVAGFGIGIVPEIAIEDDLKLKRLYKINVSPEIPKCFIAIVNLNKKEVSFGTKKLIDIIKKNNKI